MLLRCSRRRGVPVREGDLQKVRRTGDLHHGICALDAGVAGCCGAGEGNGQRHGALILLPRVLGRERHPRSPLLFFKNALDPNADPKTDLAT